MQSTGKLTAWVFVLTFLAIIGFAAGGLVGGGAGSEAAVAAGIGAIGGAGEVVPGMLALVACAAVLSGVMFLSRIEQQDRRWLLTLCFAAMLLRAVVALAIYYGPLDRNLLAEDQPGYDLWPTLLTRYWEGSIARPESLFTQPAVSRIGYYTFVAMQYATFGFSPLVPRMFNCLAGALCVILAYRIALLIFSSREARVAAIWTALFPSLILWSALNIRDIWLTVSILAVVWSALVLRERLSLGPVVTILLGLAWMQYTRSYLVPVMVMVILATLVVTRTDRLAPSLLALGLFMLLLVFLNDRLGFSNTALEFTDLDRIQYHREKMGSSFNNQKSGYMGNVDITNPLILALFLPVGVAYFLFSPFPWQLTGVRPLMTLPEMVVWYWTIPFVWLAMRQALRDRTRKRLGLLLPVVIITLAYAVSSANVGAAYRHRSQVIVLFLVFASAGFVQRQDMRERRRAAQNEARVRLEIPRRAMSR